MGGGIWLVTNRWAYSFSWPFLAFSTFLADGSLAWLSHIAFEWLILQAARTRMAGSMR